MQRKEKDPLLPSEDKVGNPRGVLVPLCQAMEAPHPSSSFFYECFCAPKTQEEEEEEQRAHQRYKDLISTLPLETRWKAVLFRQHRGFWFPEPLLPGVMALEERSKPRPSDLILVTNPKSGTTWLKALAFAVVNRSNHSFAQHPLLQRHPQDCAPFLDELFSGSRFPNLDVLPDPRVLATHIPYSVLPDPVKSGDCKIVYLSRDPKDVLASMWRFALSMVIPNAQSLSFDEAFEIFCSGASPYGPIWDHQLEYWQESLTRPEKVLFLKFEDLKKDPAEGLRRLAKFVAMPFSEAEERDGVVEEILRLCSLEKLRSLEMNQVGQRGIDGHWAINNSSFFGKGKPGGWAEFLTPEMAQKLDEITQTKLEGYGLSVSNAGVETSDANAN